MKPRSIRTAALTLMLVGLIGADLLAQGRGAQGRGAQGRGAQGRGGQGRGGQGRGGQSRAQGQQRQRSRTGQFGSSFGVSKRDLAQREDVAKELNLLEDQKEQIQELRREYFTARNEAFRSAGRDREKMRAALSKVLTEFDGKLDDILLPHQAKRLGQLANQMQISVRRGGASGTASFLRSEKPSKELKITDSQKEKLQSKAEEITKELNKKIAKLREDAQSELLGVLSTSQQTQFKDMVGEPFQFESRRGSTGRGGRGTVGRPGGTRSGSGRPGADRSKRDDN